MAIDTSDAEKEILQNLVHMIAIHIVDGSGVVQELKATIAKLKDQRLDLERVVAQNWLSASKIIQEAGKNIKSWENFINALKITYGDDKETSILKKDDKSLEESSKELWRKGTIIHENQTKYNTTEYNMSKNKSHRQTDSEIELLPERDSLLNKSDYDAIDKTRPKMQVPLANRKPSNYKPPNTKKRPPNWVIPDELGGKRGKPKPRVQFSNGRELDDEHVQALKKNGRCFFCEGIGHRASDCPENPDFKNFGDRRFFGGWQ